MMTEKKAVARVTKPSGGRRGGVANVSSGGKESTNRVANREGKQSGPGESGNIRKGTTETIEEQQRQLQRRG